MIRYHEVNRAVAQRGPKLFTIVAFANWRTTLEFRGAVGDIFGGEVEIMRTCLNRYWQAE